MSSDNYGLFVEEWSAQMREGYQLLRPVCLNLGMALFGWCVVYERERNGTSLDILAAYLARIMLYPGFPYNFQ